MNKPAAQGNKQQSAELRESAANAGFAREVLLSVPGHARGHQKFHRAAARVMGLGRRRSGYSTMILGGGRRWVSAPAIFSQIRAAMRRKTSACGLSGLATVIGVP